jgi:hypothetical protein
LETLEDRRLLAIEGLGVNGDSLSDEYASETYSYARNWVELLAQERAVDLGMVADWGSEPRNEGYEYNWARAGATSQSLIDAGQHTFLASQIDSGDVTHAVLAIGQNDFAPYPEPTAAYYAIYNGLWTQPQIQAYADTVVANISTALETLTDTGAEVVVSNIADYGLTGWRR